MIKGEGEESVTSSKGTSVPWHPGLCCSEVLETIRASHTVVCLETFLLKPHRAIVLEMLSVCFVITHNKPTVKSSWRIILLKYQNCINPQCKPACQNQIINWLLHGYSSTFVTAKNTPQRACNSSSAWLRSCGKARWLVTTAIAVLFPGRHFLPGVRVRCVF